MVLQDDMLSDDMLSDYMLSLAAQEAKLDKEITKMLKLEADPMRKELNQYLLSDWGKQCLPYLEIFMREMYKQSNWHVGIVKTKKEIRERIDAACKAAEERLGYEVHFPLGFFGGDENHEEVVDALHKIQNRDSEEEQLSTQAFISALKEKELKLQSIIQEKKRILVIPETQVVQTEFAKQLGYSPRSTSFSDWDLCNGKYNYDEFADFREEWPKAEGECKQYVLYHYADKDRLLEALSIDKLPDSEKEFFKERIAKVTKEIDMYLYRAAKRLEIELTEATPSGRKWFAELKNHDSDIEILKEKTSIAIFGAEYRDVIKGSILDLLVERCALWGDQKMPEKLGEEEKLHIRRAAGVICKAAKAQCIDRFPAYSIACKKNIKSCRLL